MNVNDRTHNKEDDYSDEFDPSPVEISLFERFIRILPNKLKPWPQPALPNMISDLQSRDRDPLMIQFYTWESRGSEHTSWWKHFEQEVPKLAQLGVTHVWLPPPNRDAYKNGVGYAVYDLWDIGEFHQKGSVATSWGTREELIHAIGVAASHGIQVLIDAVLGHRLGADGMESFKAIPVESEDRLVRKGPVKEIKGWTSFTFPGRGDKHSAMKWNYKHYTGIDYDASTNSKDIHYIPGPGRSGWSRYVDNELGNYDYLLGCDIDHTHPDVRADYLRWGTWILQTTGATGFRLDAIKHMDRRFVLEFLEHTAATTGKTVFAVSECWTSDINRVELYVRALKGKTTFFDSPLHYKFHEASQAHGKADRDFDMRGFLKNTLLGRRPSDAVTFVDNHDTQIGQSLESWVDPGFKCQAYAFILLRGQGLPCIFYGDLYPNDSPQCYDAKTAEKLHRLLEVRQEHAHGPTTDYFAYRNCIGFVRAGSRDRLGCAVVLRSGSRADVELSSGKRKDANSGNRTHAEAVRMRVYQKKAVYHDALGDKRTVTVGTDGWGVFPCPAGGAAVWIPRVENPS